MEEQPVWMLLLSVFGPFIAGYFAVFFALVATYRFSKTARWIFGWWAKDSDCAGDPFGVFVLWPGFLIFIIICCVGITLGKTLGWLSEKLIPRDIIE